MDHLIDLNVTTSWNDGTKFSNSSCICMLLMKGISPYCCFTDIKTIYKLLTVTMIIKLSKPCYIYQLSVLYILEYFFSSIFWVIFPQSLNDILLMFLCGRGEVFVWDTEYTLSTSIFKKRLSSSWREFHGCGSWISILR